MNFKKEFFNTPDYKGAPHRVSTINGYGNWRSRWEREKELNRSKNTVKDQILYIDTKPSPHDYIVTQVHAVSPQGEFVRITPISSGYSGSSGKSKGSSKKKSTVNPSKKGTSLKTKSNNRTCSCGGKGCRKCASLISIALFSQKSNTKIKNNFPVKKKGKK